MSKEMIDINEVVKHSDYADRQELWNSVYVEYLQYLVLKYINDSNLNDTVYLFGSFYNRIKFAIGRFGNSLDFITNRSKAKEYTEINDKIKNALGLEGYKVSIVKCKNNKFSLKVSSENIRDTKTLNPIKFILYLNYYYANNFFKPSVYKEIISSCNINSYGIITRIFCIKSQYSLSVLLRKLFKVNLVEAIELFDTYDLHSRCRQLVERSMFDKKELKALTAKIIKSAVSLGTKKIKKMDTDKFRLINETKLGKYFDYKNWLPELNL
jgi:hypothetical protein